MFPIARSSVLRAARSQIYPSRTCNQPSLSALARLLSTLAVLEQRDGKLQQSSLSAVAAAQKLGGSVTAFVAGKDVKGTAAAEAAKIKGLEKVVAVDNEAYEKVGIPATVIDLPGGYILTERLTRDFPKTMLLCSSTTSSLAAFLMSSLLTPPLERVFCLA